MKKEKIISELESYYLKPIGLSQGLFLLAIISSPFVFIWCSGDVAWKLALTGSLGLILTKALYGIVKRTISNVVDEAINKIKNET